MKKSTSASHQRRYPRAYTKMTLAAMLITVTILQKSTLTPMNSCQGIGVDFSAQKAGPSRLILVAQKVLVNPPKTRTRKRASSKLLSTIIRPDKRSEPMSIQKKTIRGIVIATEKY